MLGRAKVARDRGDPGFRWRGGDVSRLEERATLILNGARLFVVLCFVCPLQFLSTLLIDGEVSGPPTVSIEYA